MASGYGRGASYGLVLARKPLEQAENNYAEALLL